MPTSPDQVFAPLISDGNLVVAWHHDNATKKWTSFSPSTPAELNDLTLLAAGDIVWLELTADGEFQDQKLYKGRNVIALR